MARAALERAQALSGSDFEDNVQIACAELNGLDAIVTRNPADSEGALVPVRIHPQRPETIVLAQRPNLL